MNRNENEFNILDINCPEQKMVITTGIMTFNHMHDHASWAAKKGWQTRRAKGAQAK